MEPKRYATAAAFRRALEDRLQDIAGKEGVDLQRLRRQVAFDRLLARLFQAAQPRALPWVLKGGYAMELRIKAARTTKDIDLTMRSVFSSGEKKDDKKNLAVLEKLQEAAAFSSDDFFVYTIGEPIADLDAAPYGGARFPVEARLDGRVFVGFHLDVGIGDAVMEPLEVIEGRDWLGFAGIASPSLYMIPREQQFAEKLHAYTLPRQGAANSPRAGPGGHGSVDSFRHPWSRPRLLKQSVSRLIAEGLTPCRPATAASYRLAEAVRCACQRVRIVGSIRQRFCDLGRLSERRWIVETKLRAP